MLLNLNKNQTYKNTKFVKKRKKKKTSPKFKIT